MMKRKNTLAHSWVIGALYAAACPAFAQAVPAQTGEEADVASVVVTG